MAFSKKQLLEFVLNQDSAQFCFILYDLLVMPEECYVVGKNDNDPSFIFKYLKNYVFYGSNCFDYFKEIPHEKGMINIVFNPENLSSIQKHFHGFTCSDESGTGPFNHFLTMICNKTQFKRDIKIKTENVLPITLNDWTDNAPLNVKKLLEESIICFGSVQKNQLISCAPSPNLYIGENAPKFTIIRGVWTDPNFRGKGLATATMKKLCVKLYDEMALENIYLWVEERNPAAIKVYKKLGFKVAGKWWAARCYFQ